jgi:hypothetical protein
MIGRNAGRRKEAGFRHGCNGRNCRFHRKALLGFGCAAAAAAIGEARTTGTDPRIKLSLGDGFEANGMGVTRYGACVGPTPS